MPNSSRNLREKQRKKTRYSSDSDSDRERSKKHRESSRTKAREDRVKDKKSRERTSHRSSRKEDRSRRYSSSSSSSSGSSRSSSSSSSRKRSSSSSWSPDQKSASSRKPDSSRNPSSSKKTFDHITEFKINDLYKEEDKIKLINEIDADSFKQEAFQSKKKIVVDLAKDKILVPESSLAAGSHEEESLIHSNFLGDEDVKVDKWIKKLDLYRNQ